MLKKVVFEGRKDAGIDNISNYSKWFFECQDIEKNSINQDSLKFLRMATLAYMSSNPKDFFESCSGADINSKEMILMARCRSIFEKISRSMLSYPSVGEFIKEVCLMDRVDNDKKLEIICGDNFIEFGDSIMVDFGMTAHTQRLPVKEFAITGFDSSEMAEALGEFMGEIFVRYNRASIKWCTYDGKKITIRFDSGITFIYHLIIPVKRRDSRFQNSILSMACINGIDSYKNICINSKSGKTTLYSTMIASRDVGMKIKRNLPPIDRPAYLPIMKRLAAGEDVDIPMIFPGLHYLVGFLKSSREVKLHLMRDEIERSFRKELQQGDPGDMYSLMEKYLTVDALERGMKNYRTMDDFVHVVDIFNDEPQSKKIMIPFEIFKDLLWLFTKGHYRGIGRMFFMNYLLRYFTMAWAEGYLKSVKAKSHNEYTTNELFYEGVMEIWKCGSMYSPDMKRMFKVSEQVSEAMEVKLLK